MKNIIFSIAFLSLILSYSCKKEDISDGQSDQFVKFFGNSGSDEGKDIIQTVDGEYFVLGNIESDGNSDIVLIKADKFGNEKWTQYLGDTLDQNAMSMCYATDGSIYLAGTNTDSSSFTNILVAKFTNTGTLVWQKEYGKKYNDRVNTIKQCSDGNLMFVGATSTNSSSSKEYEDFFYMKISQDGDSIWANSFPVGGADALVDFVEKENGEFVIVGNTEYEQGSVSGTNIIVIVANSYGIAVSMNVYGGSGTDNANGIATNPSGGYFVVGSTNSTGNGGNDIYVLSIGTDIFTINWSKTFGDIYDEVGKSIIADGSNIYIAANWGVNSTDLNAYFMQLDLNGNDILSKKYGSDGTEIFNELCFTSDGGVILVGTSNFEGNGMISVFKTLPEEELY